MKSRCDTRCGGFAFTTANIISGRITSPETGVGDTVRDDEESFGEGLRREAERGGMKSGGASTVERGEVFPSAETSTGDSTMVGDTT